MPEHGAVRVGAAGIALQQPSYSVTPNALPRVVQIGEAIGRAEAAGGESTPFIAFMLETVLTASRSPQEALHVTSQVKRLLSRSGWGMSRRDILHALGLSRLQVATGALLVPRVAARVRGDDPSRCAARQESEVPPDSWEGGRSRFVAVNDGRCDNCNHVG